MEVQTLSTISVGNSSAVRRIIKHRTMLVVALLFFVFSIERYGLPISQNGTGIKFSHIISAFCIAVVLCSLNKVKFRALDVVVLMTFIFSSALSLLVALNPVKSIIWTVHTGLTLFGLLAIGYWLRPTPTQLISGAAVGALPSSVYAFIQFIFFTIFPKAWTGSSWHGYPRVYAWTYEPGYLAMVLFVGSIPAILAAIESRSTLPLRSRNRIHFSQMVILISFINLLAMFLSTGRSGWLAAAAFLLLSFFSKITVARLLRVGFIVIILAGIASEIPIVNSLVSDYFNRNLAKDERFVGFAAGMEISSAHPWLGVGPGGFGRAVLQAGADAANSQQLIANVLSFGWTSSELEWQLTPFNGLLEHMVNYGLLGVTWLACAVFAIYTLSKNEGLGKVIMFSIYASGAAIMVNQNIFRPYLCFLPLVFWGSMLAQRNLSAKTTTSGRRVTT